MRFPTKIFIILLAINLIPLISFVAFTYDKTILSPQLLYGFLIIVFVISSIVVFMTRPLADPNVKMTLNIAEDLAHTKEKAEEEQARNEAILQSSGDPLITTDESGRVRLISQSVESMLGYSKDDLIGKLIVQALPAVDDENNPLPSEKWPLTEALLTGQQVQTELTLVRKDGHHFVGVVTVSPFLVKGKPAGAVMIMKDITKEKEVDRIKTDFITLASHQLRTPLSAMKWYVEMLLNGDAGQLTAEQRELTKNVDASNERMINLVNSLLNVSKIESGRMTIKPEPTNVGEVVHHVVEELQQKFQEKKIKPIISIYEYLPKINIDPKLIHQVYLNLLTNAIQYTPEGGRISVFISKKDDFILSEVSDTGCGIPEEDKKKIFQKLYRVPSVLKLETEGTGIGLYLVKEIIETFEGHIWFESTEGKGTTFWFSLPLKGSKTKKEEI